MLPRHATDAKTFLDLSSELPSQFPWVILLECPSPPSLPMVFVEPPDSLPCVLASRSPVALGLLGCCLFACFGSRRWPPSASSMFWAYFSSPNWEGRLAPERSACQLAPCLPQPLNPLASLPCFSFLLCIYLL